MKLYATASFVSLSLLISSFGCSEEATTPNCGCDGETVRVFESVSGRIDSTQIGFIIDLEDEGLIGVLPCNEWSDEYKRDGLRIRVSGSLKQICPVGSPDTKVMAGHPFVITKIESITNE